MVVLINIHLDSQSARSGDTTESTKSASSQVLIDTVLQNLPASSVSPDLSIAASQGFDTILSTDIIIFVLFSIVGINSLINEYPGIACQSNIIITEELCRKNTGTRPTLRKWSRGHQFVVRGGGHIDTFQPLFV